MGIQYCRPAGGLKMSLNKFGFYMQGKRTKTGDNETTNKKAKYDV